MLEFNDTDATEAFGKNETKISLEFEHLELVQNLSLTIIEKILPVMFAFGLCGNILIILYFVKINMKNTLKKMSVYHYIIIRIALSDLLTCIGTPIILKANSEPSWRLGEIGCYFLKDFFSVVCPVASCWLIVLLSYARYLSLTKPLGAIVKYAKWKCSLMILLIWLLAFIASLFRMVQWKLVYIERDESKLLRCVLDTSGVLRYIHRSSLVLFNLLIPQTLMLYFYRKIKHTMSTSEIYFTNNDQKVKKRNRSALRLIKMLIIIFVISISPGHIIYAGITFIKLVLNQEKTLFYDLLVAYFDFIKSLCYFIAFSNNVFNFVIYAWIMKDFRSFLISLFSFRLGVIDKLFPRK